MRYVMLLIFVIAGNAVIAGGSGIDTAENPIARLDLIQTSIKKNPGNPSLYVDAAKMEFELQAYPQCIDYCNRAISLLEKKSDPLLLIKALHTKGNAQYYLDDKSKAETNWRQALALALSEQQAETANRLATNLGALYLDEVYADRRVAGNYSLADSFFRISYRSHLETGTLGEEHGLLTLRLMATSLQFQKKYDSAHFYYKQVIELSRDKKSSAYLGALTFYSLSLSETGHATEALPYMAEAAAIASDTAVVSPKDRIHVLHVYGEVLSHAGKYTDAYRHVDSAYQLLAADYQRINSKAYSESESKFKNEILQYKIALEKQRKNRLFILVIAVVLFATLLFTLVLNRYRKRIALEKSKQKQVSIDAFIEGEEKEKARIGRELHDGIAQQVVGVRLALQQQKADPAMVDELNRISLELRDISHALMPQTLKEYGLKIAIEDICQKIFAPAAINYEISISLPLERLPSKIEITLYRIFQELAHNIIKHSEATEVLVQLRAVPNHVLLVVEDNGKGMPQEKSKGIGISNVKSRLQLVDGNLMYDSNEQEGTTAIIRVPV